MMMAMMFYLTMWRVWWGCRGHWGVLSKWASWKIDRDVDDGIKNDECASCEIGSSAFLSWLNWEKTTGNKVLKSDRLNDMTEEDTQCHSPSMWRSRSGSPGTLMIDSLLMFWGFHISFPTIIGMIRLNVPVWFNFNSGCKAVSSSGGMGARQGGSWVETKVLTFDLRKSKKCILGMKFYSCVRRHIWGRLERKLEEIVAMESQEMHWREWKVSNFGRK